MKKLLTIALAAGLLLLPFAAFAQDYGSQQQMPSQQAPPVAQPLVREGDFAIKLAAKLDLGLPQDEATAEDLLAKADVVPENGWLSDYPVTPEIIGQIQNAVAKSASAGKLPMTAEEATRGLYSLTAELNLPTPAGMGGTAVESEKPADQPPANTTEINNYYYDQGPPIVTYYPPPAEYAYLYAWVPYPAWWFGFWFPGFYICHNFTTTVVVTSPFIIGGHEHHEWRHRAIVSNRVIDPISRRIAVVEPVSRRGGGTVVASTMLRSESGRRFRTLSSLRREPAMLNRPAYGGAPAGWEGFRSSQARRSAESIYVRSVERTRRGITTRESEGMRRLPGTGITPQTGVARLPSSSGRTERSFSGQRRNLQPTTRLSPEHYAGARVRNNYNSPRSRNYSLPSVPQRSYGSPSRSIERNYGTSAAPSHTYRMPATREGGGFRRFSGNGNREGGERSFSRSFRRR
jgi:hypothetical protein